MHSTPSKWLSSWQNNTFVLTLLCFFHYGRESASIVLLSRLYMSQGGFHHAHKHPVFLFLFLVMSLSSCALLYIYLARAVRNVLLLHLFTPNLSFTFVFLSQTETFTFLHFTLAVFILSFLHTCQFPFLPSFLP